MTSPLGNLNGDQSIVGDPTTTWPGWVVRGQCIFAQQHETLMLSVVRSPVQHRMISTSASPNNDSMPNMATNIRQQANDLWTKLGRDIRLEPKWLRCKIN